MKEKLSQALKAIPPSVIGRPSYRFHEAQEVISLGIGEPDFTTPAEVCLAALTDAQAGHTHYTSSQGDPELLNALAEYINNSYNLALNPSNILVTAGGMGGMIAFFQAVLDPGDEVLVPEPYFAPYQRNIEFAGGTMIPIPSRFENGFNLSIEAVEKAISVRSKAILLNSPNNPTGMMIPGPTLRKLARIAREKDLIILSDEVYNRFIFNEQPHQSIYTLPEMAERTVVIDSFSKTFAMTGWRLGWAFGPEWLISAMRVVAGYSTISASSVSQRAALAALRLDPDIVEGMIKTFGRRLDLVYQHLQTIPGIKVHKPDGTFYLFPNIEEVTTDSRDFTSKLLEQEQVVVFPGAAFGSSGEGCVRLACTVSETRIEQAMKRLRRFIEHRP
ncbi:MAG: pyridoxal phosphate-dependent aminotransferase [Deltaproteobacteria bacterium]|nr:pyridoxal phosphate-dependent aminotransferase [Deltaproteobacteria bacterium]